MSSTYNEDDIDVRIRRGGPSPGSVRYVQAPRQRYEGPGPSYLVPVRSRSRERQRSPSRERRASSPPPPVIINNRIYNEQPEEDDDRRYQVARSSRNRYHSRSSSRSRSRDSSYKTREEWEAEQIRKDLEAMRLANSREKEDRQLLKEYQEGSELRLAKRELDNIKDRDARAEEEERMKKAMELKRLRDEDKANEENAIRDKLAKGAVEAYKQEERDKAAKAKKLKEEKDREAKEAIERYKQEERDRMLKERQEQEEKDREYKRRAEGDLRWIGFDDNAINAFLKKEKIKKEKEKEREPEMSPVMVQLPQVPQHLVQHTDHTSYAHHSHHSRQSHHSHSPHYNQVVPTEPPVARPTYTRMALKHLSVETLRAFRIDFEYDEQDPDYVLIKRWVPEWEQDQLWRHSKSIREKRKQVLLIEEKKHQSLEPEFEWVRKKHDRRRSRSKSPSLLLYLAGARPS